MKTKTFATAFTFAALTVVAGSAAAAHDAYNRAFYGQSESAHELAGKAAYGKPSGDPWSGHEAYQRAFSSGDASAATRVEIMGKAAYGTTSGLDGNVIYRSAFRGD